MSSMRLEQGRQGKDHRKQDCIAAPDSNDPALEYPSTRYFQVHFQHLYELIETLREQLQEANRQIASQNEILRLLHKPGELPRVASFGTDAESAPAKPARTARRGAAKEGADTARPLRERA